MTGGTGFTDRDNTLKAIQPLLEQQIEGFGELFRQLSYRKSALRRFSHVYLQVCRTEQSYFVCRGLRELVVRDGKALFNTSWIAHRPCNFVDKLVVD